MHIGAFTPSPLCLSGHKTKKKQNLISTNSMQVTRQNINYKETQSTGTQIWQK